MRIENVHDRIFAGEPQAFAAYIDLLGSRQDRMWPSQRWPAMVLRDGGIAVASAGGHGPIRYVVEQYEPGRLAKFRFTRPRSWSGSHAFVVWPLPDGRTRLNHTLRMKTRGVGTLLWFLIFRPLHDAVIEDAFDRVAAGRGEIVVIE